ncbi:hypothetical protein BKA93DRAFT_840803 [Sparassis latifolia]
MHSDANRPCSTCVRSHAYAVAHAPAGANLPAHPECTFDAGASTLIPAPEHPKNRFERLERKINELEALLREKDKMTSEAFIPPANNPNDPLYLNSALDPILALESQMALQNAGQPLDFAQFHAGTALDNLADVASLMDTPTPPLPSSSATIASSSPSGSDSHLDMLTASWPKNLPNPDFLRHLVEAYFAFNADAGRLFHGPTFLTSLSLPPTHHDFPSTAVLHAICAVGSMYTGAVPPPPIPSYTVPADDPWPGHLKNAEHWSDTFAELQVKYARAEIEEMIYNGVKLLQVVQSQILIASWYWSNAKWSSIYTATGLSVRFLMPLGLNVCPPFHGLYNGHRPPSLIPPAKTVIEDEMRRNVFWLAYASERIHGCSHAWAILLDDLDVSQLLPVRGDQFEQGMLVLPEDRQWSHDRNVLTIHPVGQVDAFTLYIKACMMLSRVKNFNMRFRARYYVGDPAVASYSPAAYSAMAGGSHAHIDERERSQRPRDVRDTPAFVELDQLVAAFLPSFPPHLRNPLQHNTVNVHLFSACNAPHLAQILLHESHAIIGAASCISSVKILNAARRILNLLYDVCSTSYDLALLGHFANICWFMAGRVLVRFLDVATQMKSEEQCTILKVELEFIRSTLSRVGERVPLAHRYGKMLQDFNVHICGEPQTQDYAEPLHLHQSTSASPDAQYGEAQPAINPALAGPRPHHRHPRASAGSVRSMTS